MTAITVSGGNTSRDAHRTLWSKFWLEPNLARKSVTISLVLIALVACGCTSPKTAPKRTAIGWRPVASWSGRGNTQTESFDMQNGQWRIRWETNDTPHSNKGTFRAIVHSSVSGRFVEIAVEHQGVGSGIAYVAEDPRQFFLVIESSGVDWKVWVDEGVVGEE